MAANLAADLGTAAGCINIKATTTERLGFVGRGEGLAALAAVLLEGADSSVYPRTLRIDSLVSRSWTRAALCPPRAHGAPLARAELKAQPEDFRVEEVLSFVPAGEGSDPGVAAGREALVQYAGAWVAAEIARRAGVPAGDVGYAGLAKL